MSKLGKYASKSTLMDMDLKIGEERFKFNLFTEVSINHDGLTDELISQPSSYGFLTMLHKRLLKDVGDIKVNEKKAYSKAYIKYKQEISESTRRPNSDDVAKAKAELDRDYIMIQRKLINAQYDANRIEACVRAFEQRASMLQTASANIRKEKQSN